MQKNKNHISRKIRQSFIKKIIAEKNIATQDELANALQAHDIFVTQATISRDIKELMLVKIQTNEGISKYAFPSETHGEMKKTISKTKLAKIFHETVSHVDFTENIIVVKTAPGMANAVAATIDQAHWQEIIATLAGDDTIFVLIKPKQKTKEIFQAFQAMME